MSIDIEYTELTHLPSAIRHFMRTGRGHIAGKRWTQAGLANTIGYHSDTISNWVRGKTKPRQWELQCLAHAFELNSDEYAQFLALRNTDDLVRSQPSDLTLTPKKSTLIYNPATAYTLDVFKASMCQEIRNTLGQGPCNSDTAYHRNVQCLHNNPGVRKLVGDVQLTVKDLMLSQTDFWAMSLCGKDHINRVNQKKLVFDVSPAHVGVLSILLTMSNHLGLNIKVNYAHQHSVGIVNSIMTDKVCDQLSGFSISLGAATQLFQCKNTQFYCATVLPGCSIGIVQHPNANSNASSSYTFMSEHPSGSLLHYYTHMNGEDVFNATPAMSWEMMSDQPNENLNLVIGYPHWAIHQRLNGCILTNDPYENISPNLLFLHETLANDREYLNSFICCLKHAWKLLCEDNELLHTVVDNFTTLGYFTFMKRINGL